MTSPTGAVTDTTYDYLGRVATSTEVERDTGSGTQAYTTTYAYGDAGGGDEAGGGWVSQETSPDNVTTSYTHDAAGEVTSVTDGASDKTSYSYDSLGRKTKVTYPDGTATTTGYDPAGDVTSMSSLSATGATLATNSATFDGEGDQVSSTDAAGNSSTFTYDPTGLVTAEVQPVSATSAVNTSFAYDPDGNETLYTDGNGNPWWDTYNSWGLQESRIEPYTSAYNSAANSTFTTAYDADGRPVTETEPGGVTVTDTYNNLDELTGQSATGADAATPTRTFGYDAAGNVTSASTSNTASSGSNATSESFTYNDRGEVLTASGTAGSTSYGYNGDGQVASVADAAGTTGYTYDSAVAGDPGRPGQWHHRDLHLQPRLPGQPGLLRDGQRHPVVRVRRPAPADLRHAEDLLRLHRRLGRLRVQRRRGDHLPDHRKPGRAVVEHLHLRRGGPPHLLEQRDRDHGLRL